MYELREMFIRIWEVVRYDFSKKHLKKPVNIRVPHKRTLQSYLLNKLEQLIRSGGGGREGEKKE